MWITEGNDRHGESGGTKGEDDSKAERVTAQTASKTERKGDDKV